MSFGGAANTELSVACDTDVYDAYRAVVDRYDLRVIDLDIEGDALADTAANDRRAEAIAQLQEQQKLDVWVTLPVSPDGLTADGERLVASMLDAGVELTGVNAMTMNYGESKPAGSSMADASIDALESAARPGRVAVRRCWATAHPEAGLAPDRRHSDDRSERRGGRGVRASATPNSSTPSPGTTTWVGSPCGR